MMNGSSAGDANSGQDRFRDLVQRNLYSAPIDRRIVEQQLLQQQLLRQQQQQQHSTKRSHWDGDGVPGVPGDSGWTPESSSRAGKRRRTALLIPTGGPLSSTDDESDPGHQQQQRQQQREQQRQQQREQQQHHQFLKVFRREVDLSETSLSSRSTHFLAMKWFQAPLHPLRLQSSTSSSGSSSTTATATTIQPLAPKVQTSIVHQSPSRKHQMVSQKFDLELAFAQAEHAPSIAELHVEHLQRWREKRHPKAIPASK